MNTAYKMVLFDLDGTLTESGPGILHCVQDALTAFGYPLPPQEELRKFIGPPLTSSFQRVYPDMKQEELTRLVDYYRTIYTERGAFENIPYPYTRKLLTHLLEKGVHPCIATSKPLSQAKLVLNHFGLSSLLDYISGAPEDEHPMGKAPIIQRALSQFHMEPRDAVMIGDTKYDIIGAREAGTAFIGVLHGYGTREEMEQEGAKLFAKDLKELEPMLLNG